MKKIKFRSATLALAVAMLCMQSMAVYATPIEGNSIGGIIESRYAHTSSAIAGLSISSGDATVSGSVIGYSHIADKVEMNLYLQRKENGVWKTIDTFSETFYRYKGIIKENVDVDAGYSYRVKGSYTVYDGSKSEHITRYSATVEY